MQAEDSIGARIGVERRLAGLSQQSLADRAHASVSLLAKVEQGNRPASPALTAAVARALGIEQATLTGQPYRTASRADVALHALIPAVRRELSAYGLPPDDDPDVPLLVTDLARRVADVSDQIVASDYAKAGSLLPGLLGDLRAASATAKGDERPRIMDLLRETYDNAKRFAFDLGYADLGLVAVGNAERAAIESGDPLAVAVANSVRAWALTGSGAFDAAYRLLVGTADGLEGDSPRRWSVWGWVHLQAALSTARSGDADRTWDHFAEAERAAAAVGAGRDDFRLSFGPANVAVWGVGLAVEMQDGQAAVTRAQHVALDGELPRARIGHHLMDLARGHLLNGDRGRALEALQAARRTSPQQIRFNPQARETVRALAARERRSSESLRSLAAWMGMDD